MEQRLIDANALPEMEIERFDTTDAFEVKAKGAGRNHMRKIIEEAPTIDAISMREWNLLRNSIKELKENNTEKKDVQFVTKFLLRLMDISERREKNV